MADSVLHDLQAITTRLRLAKRVAVLTGAGVSAESGVPTFRDAMTGLWARFNPMDLATPEAFGRDPERVSRWYDQRRCDVAKCQPNAGHVALAQLQKAVVDRGGSFTLITQNVDGLHQAAGATDVIELHGTLWRWRCWDCGEEHEERGPAFASYPLRCHCGGLRRPGVVWFGEVLPEDALMAAASAAEQAELFISIGTSGEVYPAAGLIDEALAAGAKVLEINPAATPFTARVTWSLRAASGEALPRLIAGIGS